MHSSLKKGILFLSVVLFTLIFISCWDEETGITEPTNNKPIWISTEFLDSCAIGDTLSKDLMLLGADADGDSLFYEVIDSVDSNIVFIDSCLLHVVGLFNEGDVCSINVAISDGSLQDTAIFITSFYKINNYPNWSIDSIVDTVVIGDSCLINLAQISSDIDSNILTYSIINDTNGCDTILDSIFYFKPDTLLSPYNALLAVSDGELLDTAFLSIIVKDSNHTPSWTSASYVDSCKKGDTIVIDLKLLSVDIDLDSLRYFFADSVNSSLSSIDSGYMKVFAPLGSSKTFSTKVIVSDGFLSDTATFVVNFWEEIVGENLPPQWDSASYSYSVVKEKFLSVDLSLLTSDPDSGDILSYGILDTLDNIDSIVGTIYTISPTINTLSPYNVRIVVSDGELNDTAVFSFNILDKNIPPVFVQNKPEILYEIDEGDSVLISVAATDADSIDAVTIGITSLGDLPHSASSSFENDLFKWTAETGDNGAYVITFFATDGKDTTFANTTIRVGEANIAPTITVSDTFSNNVASINENDTLIVNFTFNDLDVDDNLVVSHSIPEVVGLFFTKSADNKSGTLKFSTTYNTVIGTSTLVLDTITITVTDGEATATLPFVITVNNVNRLPYFDLDSPKESYSVVAGSTLRIPFSGSDADTEDVAVVTVDETTFKAGADISIVGNEIVWNTKITDIGQDNITLRVSDGEDVVPTVVGVTVNENITAPIITIDNYQSGDVIDVTEEGSVSFIVTAEPGLQGDVVTLSKVGVFNSAASFTEATGAFTFSPNYNMATQLNPDTTFSFTFSAKGSAANGESSTFNIQIKVTNVNRLPVFDVVPGSMVIGIGNDYTAELTVSDPDGDNVTITFSDPRLSYNSGNAFWHVDNKTEKIGTSLFVNASAYDGEATVSSSQWELKIGEHVWTEIMEFDSIVDVVASEKDSLFVFLPNKEVACYSSAGEEYSKKSYTDMEQIVPMPPFSITQYSNKLFWHVQNGINIYEINGTSIDSIDCYGQSYTPMKGTYVKDADEIYIHNYTNIKAARKGINVFSTEIWSEDTILIRSMGSAELVWDTIYKGPTFIDYEPASDSGNVTYLIDRSNALWITKEGTKPDPGYYGITIDEITGAPTDVKTVSPLNDSTAWVLTNSGAVYFSAHYFQNNNHYQEVIGNSFEVIQKVVVSEADDKKAIFAITNKKIYMY